MKGLTGGERIAFALDVPAGEEVLRQIALLGRHVGWIKVNSVFIGGGREIIKSIDEAGAKVFLDLKWYDIPNTMKNYVHEAGDHLPSLGMFNVHASGLRPSMEAAVKAAQDISDKHGIKKPFVIAVTILTSIEQKHLAEVGITMPISELVLNLARLAKSCGCDGVVASAQEARAIRNEFGEDFLIVTPAIRFAEEAKDDQARLATPENAIAEGSDILVMGRSLLRGGLKAVGKAYNQISKSLVECRGF